MRIINIVKEDRDYILTFEPNWFEKYFGKTTVEKRYRESPDETYFVGGGRVYIDQQGKDVGNQSDIQRAIDQWRRRW